MIFSCRPYRSIQEKDKGENKKKSFFYSSILFFRDRILGIEHWLYKKPKSYLEALGRLTKLEI